MPETKVRHGRKEDRTAAYELPGKSEDTFDQGHAERQITAFSE
jgi:hypothetical protein